MPQAMEKQPLLGVKEAAQRLGLSFWTLYAWARTGRLPSIQLGRRRLFDPCDLEGFIKQHRVLGWMAGEETVSQKHGTGVW